ncbi:MAG: response regulator transcription factor [Reinekea sp.]
MIRIALVDDHEVVRQGLVAFLSGIEDFSLVGQGGTGADAIHIAETLTPDILILDMILPDFSGLQAFEQIRVRAPKVRVVFLSSFCESETVLPAMQNGAAGYLLKDIRPADLIVALRDVMASKLVLHPDVSALMVNALNNSGDILSQHGITDREAQVIRLIGQGFSNKDLAEQLNISQLTVKTHVSHILDKLKLDDRTQVAIFAVRNRLAE